MSVCACSYTHGYAQLFTQTQMNVYRIFFNLCSIFIYKHIHIFFIQYVPVIQGLYDKEVYYHGVCVVVVR